MNKIIHAGYTVADVAARNPAGDFTVNGTRATDVSQIVRASAVRVRNRGNRATTLQLTLAREYPTIREAQVAALGMMETLPAGPAPLEVVCGETGDTESVFYASAVLSQASPKLFGVRPVIVLTYLCGASSLVPPAVDAGGDPTVTIQQVVPSGQQTVAVDLSAATLTAPPTIVSVVLLKPDENADDIDVGNPYAATAQGFNVRLDDNTPTAGYVLEVTYKPAA